MLYLHSAQVSDPTNEEYKDSEGRHLQMLNQPKTINEEDDETSLGSGDLFDEPTGPVSLLQAARLAKQKADEAQQDESIPMHLRGINQPIAEEQEEDSLDSVDLFDEKPQQQLSLVQAARNAKAKLDEMEQEARGSHLNRIGNAGTIQEEKSTDSGESSLEHISRPEEEEMANSQSVSDERGKEEGDEANSRPSVDSNYGFSSLSSGELAELDDLLARMDNGEPFDSHRLYELDLLDKGQCGESLDEKEAADFEYFRAQRQKDRVRLVLKLIFHEYLVFGFPQKDCVLNLFPIFLYRLIGENSKCSLNKRSKV